MFETATIAFSTFFATVDPVGVTVLFTALTASMDNREQLSVGLRGVVVAAIILIAFALFGQAILSSFGIGLPSLRASGGVLLLVVGIEMVFSKGSGKMSVPKEGDEKADPLPSQVAICPLATPIIAGPGAMGAAVLLMADAEGDIIKQSIVMAALVVNLMLTFLFFLIGNKLRKFIGITGSEVIRRVMGVLIMALATQFLFDGIKQAFGLIGRSEEAFLSGF